MFVHFAAVHFLLPEDNEVNCDDAQADGKLSELIESTTLAADAAPL